MGGPYERARSSFAAYATTATTESEEPGPFTASWIVFVLPTCSEFIPGILMLIEVWYISIKSRVFRSLPEGYFVPLERL